MVLKWLVSSKTLPESILRLAFLLCFLGALSQENAKNDIGSWMVLAVDNQISERWSIPIIGIICNANLAEQTEFGFLRSGLTYKTNPNLKLTLGVAYIDSQPLHHYEFETLTTQFWIYEEASLKTGNNLKHRVRLEHRWITKQHDACLFNTRLRYRLEFKQQLTPDFYLKCTNESFLNFNRQKLDQNRFFLGLGKKMGSDLTIELGHFKTTLNGANFDRIRIAIHLKTSFFKRNMEEVTSVKK